MNNHKTKDFIKDRKVRSILSILVDSDSPMTSTQIALTLQQTGIDLKERMVRYYLNQTDQMELTQRIKKEGRLITEKGYKEFTNSMAIDKVGFVSARVDELSYNMQFDPVQMTGDVIINTSLIHKNDFNEHFSVFKQTLMKDLGIGHYFSKENEKQHFENQNEDMIKIGTICSITINGILSKNFIPITSRFGGLLEINNWNPIRFTQLIHYDGTTIDPVEIFLKGKMTSVLKVLNTGSGFIGASFREVPSSSIKKVKKINQKIKQMGLGNIMLVGRPGQPLLDIPVQTGRCGMIVAAGLNAIAAIEESGAQTFNQAMAQIYPFEQLIHI